MFNANLHQLSSIEMLKEFSHQKSQLNLSMSSLLGGGGGGAGSAGAPTSGAKMKEQHQLMLSRLSSSSSSSIDSCASNPPSSAGAPTNLASRASPKSNSASKSQLGHNLVAFHQQQQQLQQQQQQHQQQLANGAQVDSIEANKGYTFEEQFKQLYELSNNPKRKEFLDDLFQFMADRNQPVNRIPIMAKQVLDLYELYNLVVARGGLVEVINKKIWREITKGLNLPSSITSAAFTLRTQYMKYLYPYECAKNNFSHQDELQQAIDGNRREGRRATATNLAGPYGAYLGSHALPDGANQQQQQQQSAGLYSASPSPTPNHLFAAHNLAGQQQTQSGQQQQPMQLHHEPMRDQHLARPHSGSSAAASPTSAFNQQQRLYQDSIESDHEDDASIDLGHSSKRNSPIDQHQQHLDHHSIHPDAPPTSEQQQQLAAAAAAAIRQQLGAAINFAGSQSLFGQLAATQPPPPPNQNQTPNLNPLNPNPLNLNQNHPGANGASNAASLNQGDMMKQQQEQFLAALMAAAANQQQQPHQPRAQPPPPQSQPANPDQQAAARAALSMASNAMLIAAPNAPDAMAVASAAQAIGVKGAFVILLL